MQCLMSISLSIAECKSVDGNLLFQWFIMFILGWGTMGIIWLIWKLCMLEQFLRIPYYARHAPSVREEYYYYQEENEVESEHEYPQWTLIEEIYADNI